jgi:prepilin signal peptidase PulO-like enzyme (type II secretory pathway)
MSTIINSFAFIFGALIGSYLNVLILRLPKGEDTVTQSSHCTSCGETIKWYMNIPIISFIFLRGKCAYCGAKISWQYPLVELFTALVSLWLFPSTINIGYSIEYLVHFSIACSFICHIVIDIQKQLLLDKINIYLLIIILFYAIYSFPLMHWLLGGVIGFGFPFLITWLFYKLRGQIGLGGGDIKLFGILGLYLGPVGIVNNIFLSCFAGAIIGGSLILTKRLKRETPMPFGPFIILAASFQIFFPKYYSQLTKILFL